VPLTEYCDRHRLDVAARLRLFVQVCRAVQHAHQKGVIHRDLQPGNILVTEVDGKPVPKVIDFGVAKATEQRLTDLSLADDGAIVGTPAYMSPEQADPTSMDVDTRSDVYALGVILYELLPGSPPLDARQFKRGGLLELLRQVREVDAPRPSTRLGTADGLPTIAANRSTEPVKLARLLRNELDWIVLKALEKDRARRYDSASDFAQDVERFLADEPVRARPPSRWYRLTKFVRRNRVQVVAAALVLLALVAGIVGVSLALVEANRAWLAESEERGKATRLADEKQAELQRTRAGLFANQMQRVGQVKDAEPDQALGLLFDLDACPLELRDLAWNVVERHCKRHRVATVAVPTLLGDQSSLPVAINPDGTAIATGTRLGTGKASGVVVVRDAVTGAVRATLPGFADTVELLAFSPDGKTLAVVADGRPATGGPVGQPAVARPGTVRLWDLDGLAEVAALQGHVGYVLAVAFSADGGLVATGGADGTDRIWDRATGQEKHVLKGHGKEVLAVAFHPNKPLLASGGMDNVVRLWDAATGALQETWPAGRNADPVYLARQKARGNVFDAAPVYHNPKAMLDGVCSLDFSPDGTELLAGNRNWLVEVRTVATGEVRLTLRQAVEGLWSARFVRDGRGVLVHHQEVTEYDAATGQKVRTVAASWRRLPTVATEPKACAVSRAGRRVVVRDSERCDLFDLAATLTQSAHVTEKHPGRCDLLAFGEKGDAVALAQGDRVLVWDLPAGKQRHVLAGHKHPVAGMAVGPDGRTLVTSSLPTLPPRAVGALEMPEEADDVRFWDLATGESRGTLGLAKARIPAVAVSADGATLATFHWDNPAKDQFKAVITVWDAATRRPRVALDHPFHGAETLDGGPALLAFNPVDGTLASAAGRTVRLWDATTGTLIRELWAGSSDVGTGGALVGLAFTPDGRELVTGMALGTQGTEIVVWDAATGTRLRTAPATRETRFLRMALSPDGKNLVAAGGNEVLIRDVLTLQLRASLAAHSAGVFGVGLTPDGQTLVTTAPVYDPAVRFRPEDVPQASEIRRWPAGRSPAVALFQRQARFGPDGKTVLENDGRTGTMRLWDPVTARVRSEVDASRYRFEPPQFSPDGRYLVGVDLVGTQLERIGLLNFGVVAQPGRTTALVNLWDTHTDTARQFEAGPGVPLGVGFLPDGNRLVLPVDLSVTGPMGERTPKAAIRLWDVAAGRAVCEIEAKDLDYIRTVRLSPAGDTLALLTVGGRVVLADLASGTALPSLRNPANDRLDRRMGFTPDGRRLVVEVPVTGQRTVWDWRAGKAVEEDVPDVFGTANVSSDGRYELRRMTYGIELIDRAAR